MARSSKRFTLDLEPHFQQRLKLFAVLRNVTMRQYCLEAIERQMQDDQTSGRVPAEALKAGATKRSWS